MTLFLFFFDCQNRWKVKKASIFKSYLTSHDYSNGACCAKKNYRPLSNIGLIVASNGSSASSGNEKKFSQGDSFFLLDTFTPCPIHAWLPINWPLDGILCNQFAPISLIKMSSSLFLLMMQRLDGDQWPMRKWCYRVDENRHSLFIDDPRLFYERLYAQPWYADQWKSTKFALAFNESAREIQITSFTKGKKDKWDWRKSKHLNKAKAHFYTLN